MRRIAVVGSLVAVLAFSAVALAAIRHYHGKDEDPACASIPPPNACKMKFDGAVRNGRVVKVRNFTFNKIPMPCTEGPFALSNTGNPLPPMRVNAQRRFHGDFVDNQTSPTQYTHVDGRFSTNYKRATGHFRFHGDLSPEVFPPTGLHNCDTGRDDWHARTG